MNLFLEMTGQSARRHDAAICRVAAVVPSGAVWVLSRRWSVSEDLAPADKASNPALAGLRRQAYSEEVLRAMGTRRRGR
ncbi:MAG: hypothetical protein ACXW3K_11400, partial [Brevundimonas sp.]